MLIKVSGAAGERVANTGAAFSPLNGFDRNGFI